MTYEISKSQEISQDFKDFTRFSLTGFQDFKISPKISRFQIRFWDFRQDFKISLVILRFQQRFLIGFRTHTKISDFKIS